ncbi:MAG: hypothetical protein IT323_02240, partial [Anaerolineae bacterium]|nr:hypothetical protein [Anaerolineae bacterium]
MVSLRSPVRAPRRAALVMLVLLLVALCVPPRQIAGADDGPPDIPPSYEPVAENEAFRLYVDKATLAFKVLDKRSNYVWHSGIDEPADGDRLNASWRAFAQSGLSIEYLDNQAVNKRVSITNAGMSLDVTPVEQGVSARATFQEYGITLEMIVQLETDGVRVEVPGASILEQDPAYRLGLLYLYPFLGATRGGSTPGYMFLPDGTGSLIRFADSTKARNVFIGRYFGADLGMIGPMPYDPLVYDPYPIAYPVFGMVHGEGQNGFLSVVEKGAAYGELQAHPAGIRTNFNFIHNAFIYAEAYFQATNRSGAGVTVVQRQRNAFDAVVHFRFLTGDEASYVGMARSYQRYLVERGLLRPQHDPDPNIGIRLEFLGGDKEKVLFWWRFVPMTTIRQLRDILAALAIPNADVIYYGWQPTGASSMPPTSLALEGGLGSVDDLRALADQIAASGGRLSLYLDPQAAYWEEAGYSPRTEAAMAITNVSIEGFNRLYGLYFTLDAMQWRYRDLTEALAAYPNVGWALDGIGWMLFSDHRDERPFSREAAIEAYRSLLAESPQRLGFYRPNEYLWGLAQAYYDMPLGDNGYVFTSEAVPFLPIVLSGHMPYYGPVLNFSPDAQEDVLRHVEYGIYPSYFLTHEPTSNMLNTLSAWIYTSAYDQWGEPVRQTYERMNALLAPVRGQPITGHAKLAEGVFATTYANGMRI